MRIVIIFHHDQISSEDSRGDDGDNFRKPYKPTLYALMGLAAFILIIAAVNFINLSTALSMQRAKEVGVRKVIGSSKNSLIWQFLTETLLLTFMAELLSVLLIRPVLAAFSDYVPAGVAFHIGDPGTLLFLLSIMLVTTLLAGFYPARVLSSYLPVLSLKGVNFQKGSGKVNIRKVLIVFQFTISLIFVIGALVIGNQIRYMRDSDKGFDSDAIVSVRHFGDPTDKIKIFLEGVRKIPGVSSAILQAFPPMGFAHMQNSFVYKAKEATGIAVSTEPGGADFIPFYGMKLLAGRNILKGDSVREVVINETYARALGFSDPAGAVGQILYNMNKPYPIVGVVADFMENSFHEAMKPVAITHMPEWEKSVAVKMLVRNNEAENAKVILAAMEGEWKKVFPDAPFDAALLNESIGWLYDQEKKTAWLVNMAMGITIFISCMGLFGLGMYTAQRRTKEIGIRKVLGAGVIQIAAMLSKDFLLLVGISFVLASPIAWYFMEQWLGDFAYRVSIGWYIFALSALAAMTITLMAISYQAIRAALANPVNSLRTE